MKLYAEQYDTLENTHDHKGFYYLMNGIVAGASDGDASAQRSLNHFCDLYRAQNHINNFVGVVTIPETMKVVVATFPIEQDGAIYPLQFDESVSRHFIYLDSIADAHFTRQDLQDIVDNARNEVV